MYIGECARALLPFLAGADSRPVRVAHLGQRNPSVGAQAVVAVGVPPRHHGQAGDGGGPEHNGHAPREGAAGVRALVPVAQRAARAREKRATARPAEMRKTEGGVLVALQMAPHLALLKPLLAQCDGPNPAMLQGNRKSRCTWSSESFRWRGSQKRAMLETRAAAARGERRLKGTEGWGQQGPVGPESKERATPLRLPTALGFTV